MHQRCREIASGEAVFHGKRLVVCLTFFRGPHEEVEWDDDFHFHVFGDDLFPIFEMIISINGFFRGGKTA